MVGGREHFSTWEKGRRWIKREEGSEERGRGRGKERKLDKRKRGERKEKGEQKGTELHWVRREGLGEVF